MDEPGRADWPDRYTETFYVPEELEAGSVPIPHHIQRDADPFTGIEKWKDNAMLTPFWLQLLNAEATALLANSNKT
jgi:hypothetical protein